MTYLYKRVSAEGDRTFYYSGAGEVAAIVRPNNSGTFWIRDGFRTQISVYAQSVHATRAGAEAAAEKGFEVIDRGQHVRI